MQKYVLRGVIFLLMISVLPNLSFSNQKAPEWFRSQTSLAEKAQMPNRPKGEKLTFSEKIVLKKERIRQRLQDSYIYRLAMAAIISYGIALVFIILAFFGLASFLGPLGLIGLVAGMILGLIARVELKRNPELKEEKEMLKVVRILGIVSWIVSITLILLSIATAIAAIYLIYLLISIFGGF